MRSSWGAGAVLAVACIGGLAALLAPAAACTPHNCDPSSSTLTGTCDNVTDLGDGTLVYRSSAVEGPWIAFPANQTITVKYPSGFYPFAWNVMVSTGPEQDEAGATATLGAGQIAQFMNFTDTSVQLQNGSCASYYVYFAIVGKAYAMQDGGCFDASSQNDDASSHSGDASHD